MKFILAIIITVSLYGCTMEEQHLPGSEDDDNLTQETITNIKH